MQGKKDNVFVGNDAVDITPLQGEFCSFRLAPNKRSLGIHDNLYAKAFYLTNGFHSLFMISVDTVALPIAIVEKIKTAIIKKTGVNSSQILIAATHTHNGAELLGEEPFIKNEAQVGRVVNACIEGAIKAFKNTFPARIGWGHIDIPGFAKNRFQARKGGNVADADNRLDFLKIEDNAGNYRGIIWHFAAHPTTCMKAGYLSSADYYGQANKLIIDRLGGFSSFFNGACGNINPELGQRSFERSEYYGKQIAEKLTKAVLQVKTVKQAELDSAQIKIEIPLTIKRKNLVLDNDSDEIFHYFKGIEAKAIPFSEQEYNKIWPTYSRLRSSWWQHKLIKEFKDCNSEEIYLQGHRILDHLILSVPGEIFIELQFDLQNAFKHNRAMLFGYANGYSGYIPDAKSYETDCYETNPSYMHRAGQHAGEIIIQKGEKLLMSFISDEKYTEN